MTAMPFIIMTIACVQMGMTPAETLTAFTVNAARALEKDDRGVIASGKRADMIILDVENYETIPYHFARNHVALAGMDVGGGLGWGEETEYKSG